MHPRGLKMKGIYNLTKAKERSFLALHGLPFQRSSSKCITFQQTAVGFRKERFLLSSKGMRYE